MPTAIEWAKETRSYFTGCDKLSPACQNCYAEKLSEKYKKWGMAKYANGFKFTVHPEVIPKLADRMGSCFVNSMSDTHHSLAPDEINCRAFEVMKGSSYNRYYDLTKRPLRMLNFQRDYYPYGFPDNVWCGTTVESGPYFGRAEILKKVRAKVRFLSCEPLLGAIGRVDLLGIHWVICGGESGPFNRPPKVEWIRELRDECGRQGVAFFYKQLGGARPKSGGRMLDGREHNGYPDGKGGIVEVAK